MVSVPKARLRDIAMHTLDQMGVDILQNIQGYFCTGLAVGAGVRAHRTTLLPWKFAAHKSHHLANGFAAGAVGSLNLIEEAPEDDIQRENAPAAIMTGGFWREQSLRNIGAKCIAKLGKGTAFGELGKSFREGRKRGSSKEEWAEALEERSC